MQPRVLSESEIDPLEEEMDMVMSKAEEDAAARLFAPADQVGNLADGGMVGGARVTPMQNGQRMTQGRAAARRAWMWNGTESMLPLAWNPEGTQHDRARRYLDKRHCLCCGYSGFVGRQCPQCVRKNCDRCHASTVAGQVIANFYLRKEDVPFPAKFYGSIDCFLATCPRQGSKGFLTETDMRSHARYRHRMEYQAYQESLVAAAAGAAARRSDELESLRRRVEELTTKALNGQVPSQPPLASPLPEAPPARKRTPQEALAMAREAKRLRKSGAPALVAS